MSSKPRCKHGHSTVTPDSRTPSGNCRACQRLANKRYYLAHRTAAPVRMRSAVLERSGGEPFGDFASAVLGDFYKVEQEDGLLEPQHPYDPNRRAASPASGYGWPEHEYELILLARILGASWPRRQTPQAASA